MFPKMYTKDMVFNLETSTRLQQKVLNYTFRKSCTNLGVGMGRGQQMAELHTVGTEETV